MDNQQHESKPDTIEVAVAAMERLGEATAAAIATEAGFAYSTVTPKLRALEDAGRAERLRTDEGRTLWRLIPADQAADAPATPDADVAVVVETMPGGLADEPAPPVSVEATTTDDGDDDAETADPAADDQPDAAPDTTQPDDGPEPAATTHEATTVRDDAAEAAEPDDEQPDTAPDTAVAEPTPKPTADQTTDQAADDGAEPATTRRGKGALREQVLTLLREHPDTAYKVGELSKLLDGASQGAIANALHKLVGEATVTQTVERPATFQAA